MTFEQVRDRWFAWLLTEELQQLPCVVAVAKLYRRRIADDNPTVEEWRAAYARTADDAASAADDASAAADAAAAAYAAVYAASAADARAAYAASADAAAAADAYAYAAAAAAAARGATADAAYAASAYGYAIYAASAAGSECWLRMGAKLVELLGEQLPRFSNLHKVILDRITPANFDMERWHCDTTHCRAGHAIDAAGPAGYALEDLFGCELAASAIYLGNTGMIPDFRASTDEALDDIRRCAGAGS